MSMILLGIYIGIAICVFLFFGFFTILGGKSEDLWKPFVAGPLWICLFNRRFRHWVG